MTLQKEIIQSLGVKSFIEPEKEIEMIVNFLQSYLIVNTHLKTFVLGISGGQDSTLAGILSQIAICKLREKTKNKNYSFIAVRLPYGIQLDEQDCQDALKFINPDKIIFINIKEAVLASECALKNANIAISNLMHGNQKARERMKIQYSIAASTHGIVIGTDHAAEAITGFYTKYGDGGVDINPLFHLNKRQGKQLLKILGCPEHLYLKNPTAGLEDEHPYVLDEVILKVTYQQIDDYLEGKTIDEIAAKTIESWYLKTNHKRHMPINIFDSFWK
ncbi:ammonia-dependent NAD(+) synthetase [Pantoea sp. Aalb]|uniref:ammonia-dependent NAD(+) synthetase n=1 Tax=Pantoea sp. Aalb TaxID=2576762 RepID=UPI00132187AE|nr:ammonia-dependent NAD(+) synthetase [Pantoea sp. Aalb]MXP67439.1 ammonia-dependent NAD(+) synthetase [Pantoea sp. Aalb]